MRISLSKAAILVATLWMGSCATKPFARTEGPVRNQATSVALVGQSCDREIDPNWPRADVLGLDVRVRVANSGASVLTFDPARTVLSAAGQSYGPHRSDSASAIPLSASRTFVVHFLEREGDLACNVPMSLALDQAVTLSGTPVTFGPISFLASDDDI